MVSIWLACSTWDFGLKAVGLNFVNIHPESTYISKHCSPSLPFLPPGMQTPLGLPLEIYLYTCKYLSFEFCCSDKDRELDVMLHLPRIWSHWGWRHVCTATTSNHHTFSVATVPLRHHLVWDSMSIPNCNQGHLSFSLELIEVQVHTWQNILALPGCNRPKPRSFALDELEAFIIYMFSILGLYDIFLGPHDAIGHLLEVGAWSFLLISLCCARLY